MRLSSTESAAASAWPALPYDAWKDTYATLHMWTQVVGKIALARAAPMNHCWAIAFHFTSRGLHTDSSRTKVAPFTIAFDFIDHQLVIETSDAVRRTLPLASRSVAEFYGEVMATLNEMSLPVQDLADAGGDSVAGPIRARHHAPRLRPRATSNAGGESWSGCTRY